MDLYFAYGSNMRSARLFERIGPARVVGAARLPGWTLRFDKPGRDGTFKANLVPRVRARAWGVAYALPDEAWPILDRFEPSYERVRLRVADTRGGRLEAQVYLYTAGPGAGGASHGPPSAAYLAHLLEGAREHGLPAHYLARIRSAARGR